MAVLLMFSTIDKVQILSMLWQSVETQMALKKQKKKGIKPPGERRENEQHPDRENVTV